MKNRLPNCICLNIFGITSNFQADLEGKLSRETQVSSTDLPMKIHHILKLSHEIRQWAKQAPVLVRYTSQATQAVKGLIPKRKPKRRKLDIIFDPPKKDE